MQPNTAFLNELKNKLPEFFTKDGSFDLNKFKDQLKDKNVNELSEGYQLGFIGKDYARRQAGEMPSTVIVPDEKQNQGEGKDSKNLFFTGDNLEVLRHLQNNYQNKIDVIYIDPPYNTGSDGFVYPDSFEYSDDKLKEMFGLDDDQVERLKSIQGKASHSAWLTFMYPRLVLAKRLLTDAGVLFVSIDDNEDANLFELLESIFGEQNFVAQFIVTRSEGGGLAKQAITGHDYLLVYAKNINKFEPLGKPKDIRGKIVNKNGIEYWIETDWLRKEFGKYGTLAYEDIVSVKGQAKKNEIDKGLKIGKYVLIQKGAKHIVGRLRRVDEDTSKFYTITKHLNKDGVKDLRRLHLDQIFNYPKPVSLIKEFISGATIRNHESPIILDFFAGSSTTADAVMQLNAEDGGHRRFIMVQLPEKTYHTNKNGEEVPNKGGKVAYDAGFKSIDEISRERIRRAAKKIREDNELTLPENFDGSFKHYRVVKPVKQTLEEIDDFDPNNTNLFTDMVDGFSSKSLGIDGDATGEETILTTWLAKDGYSFDADVEEIKLDNYTAHKVEDNRLYLINEGWGANQTKELLNQLGTHQLEVQSVVIFGYSFNVAELRELENGLKQLDSKVTLIKRY
ncbi:site-specific DNA-methyltransferase [Limosilactobacillus reuteri]|uniref:site-specific DNA-methyltransferase n=1 Tax=Limosilactobacillus reuteri TaxID=1598 RepID=UPI001E4D86BA|nr:site-specific DNA-methyltransferase [Limosilactobacillus reuteri]MCC4340706.1 site-specific DNA-methyltransferase [Limosilactobacillus reuteri]